MFNKERIAELASFIESQEGIGDKDRLAESVRTRFHLIKDRSIYYCEDFAIRFAYNGKNDKKWISNTVLGLARVKKYDDRPLILCIVTHNKNHLALMNSSFIKKTSHSSKKLAQDNIRGSVNISNIERTLSGYDNEPGCFEKLYEYHEGRSFEENYERIVSNTVEIKGRAGKYNVSDTVREKILAAADRAIAFCGSEEYRDLKSDLDRRVSQVKGEIAIAAPIRDNKIRGGIIEYLITDNGSPLKDQIVTALHNNEPVPDFKTEDRLGDFSKTYPGFHTETDIKTKVLSLNGNPKAYNIDKLLEFLAEEKSVYMIYLLGIDEKGTIISRLCSGLDIRLIQSAKVEHHWSGKNSRGTVQFDGHALKEILNEEEKSCIDAEAAKAYLKELMNR